jgi:hypothetical protein
VSKPKSPIVEPSFAPRALLMRSTITAEVTPFELYLLIETLQARAVHAAEDPDQCGYADHLFQRIAQLRERVR